MAEEIRRVTCIRGRVTDEPCMNPARWEVVGPMMAYYCDEHIEERIADAMDERWEQSGAESYLHELHEAIEVHYKLAGRGGVLCVVNGEVLTQLEEELERARQAYQEETGEEPPPTYAELDREAFVEEWLRKD